MTLVSLTLLVTAISLIGYRLIGDRLAKIPFPGFRSKTLGFSDELSLKNVVMIIISLAVLGSSLYIILSKGYDEGTMKWAYGVVGSILGFWIRPEK